MHSDRLDRTRTSVHDYREFLLVLAIFLLALLPRAFGLGLFSTADEESWMKRSYLFLTSVSQGDWGGTLLYEAGHPGVTTRWTGALGILAYYFPNISFSEKGIEVSGKLLSRVYTPSLSILATMRYPTVLLTSLFVVAAYLIIKKTLGKRVAVLVAFLLAFDPFYVALSRVLHHDGLQATFALLSVLCLVMALDAKGWGWFAASGVCGGLAFLSKSPAIVLAPLTVAIVLAVYVLQPKEGRDLKRMLIGLAIWCGAMVVTTFVVWPAMWVQPVESLRLVFATAGKYAAAPHARGNFFWGQPRPDPGPFFYPVAILFRGSPLVLVGAFATVVSLVSWSVNWLRSAPRRAISSREVLLLSLWGLVVAYVVLLSLGAKKFDRYALSAFLAIDILGAVGVVTILQQAAKRWFVDRDWLIWRLGLAVCIVVQVGLCLYYYPHYFGYYNPALGGPRVAKEVLLVGRHEGSELVAQYLDSKENSEKLYIGTNYVTLDYEDLFKGRTLAYPYSQERSGPWAQLDYLVFYQEWLQRNALPRSFAERVAPAGPEYVVEMRGLEYARVYKIPKNKFLSLPSDAVRTDVGYDNGLKLVGYKVRPVEIGEGGRQVLPVTLYWQIEKLCVGDYRLALKLLNDAETIWAFEEGYPVWRPPNCALWQQFWRGDLVFPDDHELEIYPGTPPGSYNIEPIILRSLDKQELRPLGNPSVLLGPVELPTNGGLTAKSVDMQKAVNARLSDQVLLLGYSLQGGKQPGSRLQFTVFWQCLAQMDKRYKIFVHVIGPQGTLLAQRDSEPVTGFYPTDRWTVGEIVRDQYEVVLPADVDATGSALQVGMYLAETGERLPVLLSDGKTPENRAVELR